MNWFFGGISEITNRGCKVNKQGPLQQDFAKTLFLFNKWNQFS